MARAHGIYGFCYYHYWFGGKRILERPVEGILKTGSPDFPFMFCWANENWTRAWDGGENEILLSQKYDKEDYLLHVDHLIPFFEDPRYIRIGQRPVFCIYNADHVPDIREMIDCFRQRARHYGIDLYLCRFERYLDENRELPEALGFDAAVEFQPFSRSFYEFLQLRPDVKKNLGRRISNKFRETMRRKAPALAKLLSGKISLDKIYNYADFVEFDMRRPESNYKIFPSICPSWDNTPRRGPGKGIIFRNSTPEIFGKWARQTITDFTPASSEENFLFINAWNEWAEGNHLEPCLKYGSSYLDAFSSALKKG